MQWNIDFTKFLTSAEMKKLEAATKERAETGDKKEIWKTRYIFILLALQTGLRVAEICALKVKDLFFDGNNFLRVQHGKGNKARNVMLPKRLKGELQAYILEKDLQVDDFLLVNSWKKPYTRNGLQKAFKACARLAGLSERYSIHSCRHSYASLLYQRTKDLRLVQNQLGHSSITVSSIYSHLNKEETANTLDEIFT